jgi:hypothetical protein
MMYYYKTMVKFQLFKPLNNFNDKKLKNVSSGLPSPPFRWILVGTCGCGKTQMIFNVLFNQKYGYSKYFDEIYVCCASKDDLLEYKNRAEQLNLTHKFSFTQNFDNDNIKEIFDQIEDENTTVRKRNPSRVLFVMDDQIANEDFSKPHKMNVLDEIYIRGRHAQISTLISTQQYHKLNINMRKNNTTCITVYSQTSKDDLELISEDYSNLMPSKQLYKFLKQHLQGQYDFISIDKKAKMNERIKNKEWNVIEINENSNESEKKVPEEDNIANTIASIEDDLK